MTKTRANAFVILLCSCALVSAQMLPAKIVKQSAQLVARDIVVTNVPVPMRTVYFTLDGFASIQNTTNLQTWQTVVRTNRIVLLSYTEPMTNSFEASRGCLEVTNGYSVSFFCVTNNFTPTNQ